MSNLKRTFGPALYKRIDRGITTSFFFTWKSFHHTVKNKMAQMNLSRFSDFPYVKKEVELISSLPNFILIYFDEFVVMFGK